MRYMHVSILEYFGTGGSKLHRHDGKCLPACMVSHPRKPESSSKYCKTLNFVACKFHVEHKYLYIVANLVTKGVNVVLLCTKSQNGNAHVK
jgi:hypothetical protein